jgi:hypothetical protein
MDERAKNMTSFENQPPDDIYLSADLVGTGHCMEHKLIKTPFSVAISKIFFNIYHECNNIIPNIIFYFLKIILLNYILQLFRELN